ncbi:hypothetical protein D5018_07920 [Parashewanella curva]|uniref:Uncharacterized protein n=1 Tax=Parashewanella curva TaxID=2338552 RepID=A0A3L8PXY7_9GAMM|nr:hypothetical protein [Parashewanella curva]RLV60184.1 hypothetical protein D5018_07920 [Parashewanella curva]
MGADKSITVGSPQKTYQTLEEKKPQTSSPSQLFSCNGITYLLTPRCEKQGVGKCACITGVITFFVCTVAIAAPICATQLPNSYPVCPALIEAVAEIAGGGVVGAAGGVLAGYIVSIVPNFENANSEGQAPKPQKMLHK